jgi:subtilisin family serine protease
VLTKATAAQARHVTGTGVTLCIADTGIDAHHPDLIAAYTGGFDLVDNDEDPDIGNDPGLGEHGTLVAGVIAAALNRKGVRGVAYDAKIRHARVLGPTGTGPGSVIMSAVARFADEGCRVINLSLGTDTFSSVEQDFYRDLLQRHPDLLVVAAAGNGGQEGISYPARFADVLAVGAVDRTAAIATFSNTGPELGIVGPGVSVLSSVPRGAGSEAFVTAGKTFDAVPMGLAGQTSGLKARLVDCGTGNTAGEFPRTARGAIALMRRGDAFFYEKVENAMNAGAVGAVIYNNVDQDVTPTLLNATASDGRPWIPVVMVSRLDGALLQKRRTATLVNGPSDWNVASGTSFAAPHVAGIAALVLSVNPALSRSELVDLLETTAADLGDPGPDPIYGWGLVDADAATRAAASP